MTLTINAQVMQVLIAPDKGDMVAQPVESVQVTLQGFAGDRHAGDTYRTGGRTPQFPRGTTLRNTRQVSIVAVDELAAAAQAMDLPQLEAAWLGANLLLDGVPRLTLLPPGTRLYFAQEAVLVVEGENLPCSTAGEAIARNFPQREGLASLFPKAAINRRGLVAWVERAGYIARGDAVRVEVVPQRIYSLPDA